MARRKELNEESVIDRIMLKKEFSKLPKQDVKKIYSVFDKRGLLTEEKIKNTRDLLRKMYTAFISGKLLTLKNKDTKWFLRKHISTEERLDYYEEIYKEIFKSKKFRGKKKKVTVIDFGCGINGFSYEYFKKIGVNVSYLGIEPVGQLVDLQNNFFKKNDFSDAKCSRGSLFDLKEMKKIVSNTKKPRIGFFFKVLDSLEMLKRNYSKIVLKEIVPFFDLIIVSWATASLESKKKFYVNRNWIRKFIEEEFLVIKEFDFGIEHYVIFSKK